MAPQHGIVLQGSALPDGRQCWKVPTVEMLARGPSCAYKPRVAAVAAAAAVTAEFEVAAVQLHLVTDVAPAPARSVEH